MTPSLTLGTADPGQLSGDVTPKTAPPGFVGPPSRPWYDAAGARQAGLNDDDILGYLNKDGRYDSDGALKAGLSKSDIIDYLSMDRAFAPPNVNKPAAVPPPSGPQGLNQTGALTLGANAPGQLSGDVGAPKPVPSRAQMEAGAPGVPGAPLPQGLKSDAQIQAEAPTAVNPRTGETFKTTPFGHSALDFPFTGAQKIAQGVERMAAPAEAIGSDIGRMQAAPGAVIQGKPQLTPELAKQGAAGVSKVIGGALEATAPFFAPSMAAAPLRTAATLAIGAFAQAQVSDAMKQSGIAPEYADAVGDLVGLAAGYAAHGATVPEALADLIRTAQKAPPGTAEADSELLAKAMNMVHRGDTPGERNAARNLVRNLGHDPGPDEEIPVAPPAPAPQQQPPVAVTPPPPAASQPEPQPTANVDAYQKAHAAWRKSTSDAIGKFMKDNPGATADQARVAVDGTAGPEPQITDFKPLPPPPAPPPEPAAEAPKPEPPPHVKQPSAATPNLQTAFQHTQPESPETYAIQIRQMGSQGDPLKPDQRKVVMFPAGQGMPAQYPPGVATTSGALWIDENGQPQRNQYWYRPDLTDPSEIKKAERKNTLMELLGNPQVPMEPGEPPANAPDKSALQGPPVAVVARAPDGTEADTFVTDEAHLPHTVINAHAVTPEGGSIEVKTPEAALGERQGIAPEPVTPPAPPAAPVAQYYLHPHPSGRFVLTENTGGTNRQLGFFDSEEAARRRAASENPGEPFDFLRLQKGPALLSGRIEELRKQGVPHQEAIDQADREYEAKHAPVTPPVAPAPPLSSREAANAARRFNIDTTQFDLKTIAGRKALNQAIAAAGAAHNQTVLAKYSGQPVQTVIGQIPRPLHLPDSRLKEMWGKPDHSFEGARSLIGGTYESYGGGIDQIQDVTKTPGGTVTYKVRDLQTGDVRTHNTFIDPRIVNNVPPTREFTKTDNQVTNAPDHPANPRTGAILPANPLSPGAVAAVPEGNGPGTVRGLSGKANGEPVQGEPGATAGSEGGGVVVPGNTEAPVRRITGTADLPLIPAGEKQVDDMVEKKVTQPLDAVYYPDSQRGSETAERFATKALSKPVPLQSLHGWGRAIYEGQPADTVKREMTDLILNPDVVPPGVSPISGKPGQSWNQMAKPMFADILNILRGMKPGQRVLIVTSGGNMQAIDAWGKAGYPADGEFSHQQIAADPYWSVTGKMFELGPKGLDEVPSDAKPGLYFVEHGQTAYNSKAGVSPTDQMIQAINLGDKSDAEIDQIAGILGIPGKVPQKSIDTATKLLNGVAAQINAAMARVHNAVINTPQNAPVELDALQKLVSDNREMDKLQAEPDALSNFRAAVAAAERILATRGMKAAPFIPGKVARTRHDAIVADSLVASVRTATEALVSSKGDDQEAWDALVKAYNDGPPGLRRAINAETPISYRHDKAPYVENKDGFLVGRKTQALYSLDDLVESEFHYGGIPRDIAQQLGRQAFADSALEGAREYRNIIYDVLVERNPEMFPVEPPTATVESDAPTARGIPSLINAVFSKLHSGGSLGNVTELTKLAEQHLGGDRTSGAWTPKDMFDAMEGGINKHLVMRAADLMAMDPIAAIRELRDLMSRITTQGVRTQEQIDNQQFSTPPTLSFVANKVAGVTPDDVFLETSAGNGGLAVWARGIGADVHVNEIAAVRQQVLESIGFGKPTAHDGEVINALLDWNVHPTVVVINPPFSAGTVKSHKASNNNKYGFNHVESALQRLQPGGRLVAILGGGQANEPEGGASFTAQRAGEWFRKIGQVYNIRANVRVSGKEYSKYGTSFATRIIVIDKNGPTTWGAQITGNVDTVEEAYDKLKYVTESRPIAERFSGDIIPGPKTRVGPDQPAGGVAGTRGSDNQGAERGEPERRPEDTGLGGVPGGRGEPVSAGEQHPAEGGDRSVLPAESDIRSPEGAVQQPAGGTPGSGENGNEPVNLSPEEQFLKDIQDKIDAQQNAGAPAKLTAEEQFLKDIQDKIDQQAAPAPPPVKAPAPRRAPSKKTATAPNPAPPAPPPVDDLDAEEAAALQKARDRRGARGQSPQFSVITAPDPDRDLKIGDLTGTVRDDILDLAVAGTVRIMKGAGKYEPWAEEMMKRAGDLVRDVAKDAQSIPEQVLRLVHSYARMSAIARGVVADTVDKTPEFVAKNGPERLQLEAQARDQNAVEDTDAYVVYQPSLKGKAHPGSIVETKTMATVSLPKLTAYRPHLPANVDISNVQMEAVVIAGIQNATVLPGGYRASALVGDSTGLGKGRIAAAIAWDNWRQGQKRIAFVSQNDNLMQDFARDLAGIGAGPEMLRSVQRNAAGRFVFNKNSSFQSISNWSGGQPIQHEGVLFISYPMLSITDKQGNRRVDQLEKWLRGEDEADGAYIVYDESHNLKNAVASIGPASARGVNVLGMMDHLPSLRSVSLSATAATDVNNLGYLNRLGIWGPGTSFPAGFEQFQNEIGAGRLAAMELIARELKALGKYVSRTLSYKGVVFDEVEHPINADQKEILRVASRAWRTVFNAAQNSINNTTNGGTAARGRFNGEFYSAQQRFYSMLITTMKIPTAVRLANEALAKGQSVVLTIQNTGEAIQKREEERVKREQALNPDDDEVPDFDFGPKEMLVTLIRKNYPVQQFRDDVDAQGNPIKVPMFTTDENGNTIPLLNPQAVAEREALIKDVSENLHMPQNPLDTLIDMLGGDKKVAEITGRKKKFNPATGEFASRAPTGVSQGDVNLYEAKQFQDGDKRIAVLSSAGGTGISLHAGIDAKNQQPRLHITLQVGWSADKAMQMLGRTHRSGEVHAPRYVFLVSDLGGEKRFISTIAKRLGSLGALSKGQKDANVGSSLMDKVNFESQQGREASVAFYNQLLRGETVPGVNTMSGVEIIRDLGVLKTARDGSFFVQDSDKRNVTRLLNRLLALDPDVQNSVYDYYYDIFEAQIQRAIQDGTLDTGVQALPGDTFDVKEQRLLATDPETGAQTFYYPVDAKTQIKRVSPEDLEGLMTSHQDRGHNPRIMRNKDGRVIMAVDAAPVVHADGTVSPAVRFVRPGNAKWARSPLSDAGLAGYKTIPDWAESVRVAAEKKLKEAEDDLRDHLRYEEERQERHRRDLAATAQTELEAADRDIARYGTGVPEPAENRPIVVGGNTYGNRFALGRIVGAKYDEGRRTWAIPDTNYNRNILSTMSGLKATGGNKPALDLETMQKRLAEARDARAKAERDLQTAKTAVADKQHGWADEIEEDRKKIAELQEPVIEAQKIADKADAWGREQWADEYENSPSQAVDQYHLIGGAVLRYWNAIKSASPLLKIYTTTDTKTGQRIVGVRVMPDAINGLIARITGSHGAMIVTPTQMITDVLINGTQYTLEGGIQVRQNRISRKQVIQLLTVSQPIIDDLRSMGVSYERGVTSILYIPSAADLQHQVLSRVLARYPAIPDVGASDAPSASLMGEDWTNIPTDADNAHSTGAPEATYRRGTILANGPALRAIGQIFNRPNIQGVRLTPANVRQVIRGLPDGPLRQLFEAHAGEDLAVASKQGSLNAAKQAVRHERFHQAQSVLPEHLKNLEEPFLRHPLADRAARVLDQLGYSRGQHAIEIGAHLAAGQFTKLGLTRDEAKTLARIYFNTLRAVHGDAAVDNIVTRGIMPAIAKEAHGAQNTGRVGVNREESQGRSEGVGGGAVRSVVRQDISQRPEFSGEIEPAGRTGQVLRSVNDIGHALKTIKPLQGETPVQMMTRGNQLLREYAQALQVDNRFQSQQIRNRLAESEKRLQKAYEDHNVWAKKFYGENPTLTTPEKLDAMGIPHPEGRVYEKRDGLTAWHMTPEADAARKAEAVERAERIFREGMEAGRKKAEDRLSPRAGQFPALSDLLKKLSEEDETGKRHISFGSMLSRLALPGRNLAEIRKASRDIYNAAITKGAAKALASAVMHNVIPEMTKSLKGTGISVHDLFAAYQQSRLNALREMFGGWTQDALDMNDEQTEAAVTQAFPNGQSTLLEMLGWFDDKFPDAEIKQSAAHFAAQKDWESLRELAGAVFARAAMSVVNVQTPERYGQIGQAIHSNPKVAEAHHLYKDIAEKEMADAHAKHDGVFGNNGDLDTYFPLMANEKPGQRGVPAGVPWNAPKNQNNFMALGMSSTGYNTEIENFAQHLSSSLQNSARFNLHQALVDSRWGKIVDARDHEPFKGPDGKEYEGTSVPIKPSRTLIVDGKPIRTSTTWMSMPVPFYEALKELLDNNEPSPNVIRRGIRKLSMLSTKLLPFELAAHSYGLWGALYGNTPFFSGDTAFQKAMTAPLFKRLYITYRGAGAPAINAASRKLFGQDLVSDPYYPSSPENARKLVRIAKVGALPPRSNKVTYSKEYSEMTGAKREPWYQWGPVLYGPNGVDARTRLMMYDMADAGWKKVHPGTPMPDDFLGDFVNQLGNYTPEFQGVIEKALKGWSGPFATAGMTRLVNGFHAATGTGPAAQLRSGQPVAKIADWIVTSALFGLAAWLIGYRVATGRWPMGDPRSRVLEIPVGGGNGPIDAFRHTKFGDLQWGIGSEVGTIKLGGALMPLSQRVLPREAINNWMHGGSWGQVASGGAADVVNAVTHPVLGPVTRAVIAASGKSPYMTGTFNQAGKLEPQFAPSIPKQLKPGFLGGFAPGVAPGGLTKHPGAAAEFGAGAAAGFGQLSGTLALLGPETGAMGADEKKGNLLVRAISATIMPLLAGGISLGNAYNPYQQQNYLMQQKRALAEMSLPDALKTFEAANPEEKQDMYRVVRDKVFAAKVQGRLTGDTAAIAQHYFRVTPSMMMTPAAIQ